VRGCDQSTLGEISTKTFNVLSRSSNKISNVVSQEASAMLGQILSKQAELNFIIEKASKAGIHGKEKKRWSK
jgi:hypothetical protein